ncbi:hypothetical protein RHMOL_Rhmol01G0022400 [Rhododendron molle]|uniref:Uncharacterized protein n=1 Tax=Rhododendron molle TaxID=49168 RepID=A0ACC0PYR4_RHOML|nr:hypothetical protein RHMOL_Rhmol01G0022400 [Rhododendron molle]
MCGAINCFSSLCFPFHLVYLLAFHLWIRLLQNLYWIPMRFRPSKTLLDLLKDYNR